MKKLITILGAFLLILSLTGCSPKKKDFIGEWKIVEMTHGEETINLEEDGSLSMSLEFLEDGTLKMKTTYNDFSNFEEEIESEWSIKKDGSVKVVDDDEILTINISKDKKVLTLYSTEEDYQMKLVKVK